MHLSFSTVGPWLLARSQEKSTWAGVAVVLGCLLGHQLGDSAVQAITFIGQFIGAGLIAASTRPAA